MKNKIKFGILCNSLVFEAWEASCLEHLLNHPDIELKLLVLNEQQEKTQQGIFQKLTQYPYRNFLYRFYKRFILKASSYQQISLAEKFKEVPKLTCKVIKKKKYDEYFLEEDVAKIKSFQLDFLLRFGFNIIKGSILESCSYGVWSFHHADNEYIRGGPIGFWEIFLRRNTSAAVLQQLNTHLDQGKILRKGYLKTIDHSFSENIDQLTQMAAIWPLQVCIDILNKEAIFNHHAEESVKGKLYKYPRNATFIYFIFILFIQKIKFHYTQLFRAESWQIARLEQSIDDLINFKPPQTSYLSKANAEFYLADPFFLPAPFYKKILFEYYHYKERIGKIAMSDFDGNKITFLKFDEFVHRSYPFCIAHENEVYCLPEQADSGKVTLYKIDLEGNTIKVTDLISNFKARDTSVIFFDEKWWLFCTKADDFENAGLYIFYGTHLNEPFKPHQNNPVKVDVRNARPAGSLYVKDNVLYRPAQDCAAHYGHKVNINKITRLSPFAFEEKIVAEIDASIFGNFMGIHHVCIQDEQLLVDLKQSRFSFYNFKNQIKRKLKKLV